MSHPAERLGNPPAPRFALSPPLPRSPPLDTTISVPLKFRLNAAVASASARMGCEPVRTAWTRGGVRLDDRHNGRASAGIRPRPIRQIEFYDRSDQFKDIKRGRRPCHRSAGPIHEGWPPCSHTRPRDRGVSDSIVAQKPVTLRNGQAIRGSEHSTPGRRIKLYTRRK